MKHILALILSLSMFLIQIHGITHADVSQHNKTHHCPVCENRSHQPLLLSLSADFDFSQQYVFDDLFFQGNVDFIHESYNLKIHSPRAPPIT